MEFRVRSRTPVPQWIIDLRMIEEAKLYAGPLANSASVADPCRLCHVAAEQGHSTELADGAATMHYVCYGCLGRFHLPCLSFLALQCPGDGAHDRTLYGEDGFARDGILCPLCIEADIADGALDENAARFSSMTYIDWCNR